MEVFEINADTFEQEVLESDVPVVVDFWAEWCGPCRMLAPTLHELAEERDDVKVCKINVDNDTPLAISHGINVIPTLLLFKDGKELRRSSGVLSKAQLNEFIDG